MKLPKPSLKQSIIIGVLIVILVIGSGFLTKRFNEPKKTDIDEKFINQKNKERLFKADNHLQTITQPNDIKKELANNG